MSDQKYLYVVLTATPYKTGRFIRLLSGETYNHVSIATEENLRRCYAFGRKYYHTPLYAGFVTEKPSRFWPDGKATQIKLFQLPLTDDQQARLEDILNHMHTHRDAYLYNYFSLSAALFHQKVRVRDAFTCSEFVISVLSRLGFDFDDSRFYTITAIERRLEPYHVYTGTFPALPEEDHAYYRPNPIPHPIYTTFQSFLALFWRKATAW